MRLDCEAICFKEEEEEEDDWLSKCKLRGSLIFEKKEPIEVLDALLNWVLLFGRVGPSIIEDYVVKRC